MVYHEIREVNGKKQNYLVFTKRENSKIVKKIGVVLRPSTPELKDGYIKLEKIFRDYDIEVLLESKSALMIDMNGESFEKICKECDFLVSFGGDGTLISTVRRSFDFDIPILGVHAGNLGFLADLSLDELDSFVQKIIKNQYKIDERAVLEATVIKKIITANHYGKINFESAYKQGTKFILELPLAAIREETVQ